MYEEIKNINVKKIKTNRFCNNINKRFLKR